MKSIDLPPRLAEAAAHAVAPLSGRELTQARRDLTRGYGDRDAAPGARVRTPRDVAAYAVARLPATYAAVSAVLGELDRASLSPATHLDIGAGPGTALWAAAAAFDSIRSAVAVEPVEEMARVGRAIASKSDLPAVRDAEWVARDARRGLPHSAFDLVTIAFVLNELSGEEAAALVRAAWARATAALVIVEPGTPAGYRRVIEARAALLRDGAATAAPCPHDLPCPMSGGDWCHFAVRLARSAEHRAAKDAQLGHEDEKYSYAVLVRDAPVQRATARILRHPQVRSGHVRLELCTPEGLRSEVVSRRDREAFRRARKASWGDDLGSIEGGGTR